MRERHCTLPTCMCQPYFYFPFWYTPSRDILRKMHTCVSLLPKGHRSTTCLPLTPFPCLCLQGSCGRPWQTMEAFQRTRGLFPPPVCSVTCNPRPDLCIPMPCCTGASVCPQQPSTSLSSRARSTLQRSIEHWFRKEMPHGGIFLLAAERTARRRQQHRSTPSRLKKRFAHQRVPHNGTTPFSTGLGENCLLKHA